MRTGSADSAVVVATWEFGKACVQAGVTALERGGDGNLYAAHCGGEEVLRITPEGEIGEYARGPGGRAIACANYPAFDRSGNMYLSESGDWSGEANGHLLKIPPGGGEAELWYCEPVDTPNAIALDAEERHLYFVETFGNAVAEECWRILDEKYGVESVLPLDQIKARAEERFFYVEGRALAQALGAIQTLQQMRQYGLAGLSFRQFDIAQHEPAMAYMTEAASEEALRTWAAQVADPTDLGSLAGLNAYGHDWLRGKCTEIYWESQRYGFEDMG